MNNLTSAFSFLVLFLFLGTTATGQNISIKVPRSGKDQVHPFVGCDNRLIIVVEGKMCRDLILSTDNGRIEPSYVEGCYFTYRPVRVSDTANIYFATAIGSDTTIFKKVQLKTRPLPFKLTIGGIILDCNPICQHKIKKRVLLASSFRVESINMDVSGVTKVVSLEVRVLRDSKTIFSKAIPNYDKKAENQLKKEMEIIQSGDLVILRKVRHKNFSDILDEIDRIHLTIK